MKTFFALVLSCAILSSAAQKNPEAFHFKTAVSFNPFVLLATDNTAMLGAEQRLPHHLAAVLDAGYIFGTYYLQNASLKGTTGFSLRPGLKWYNKSDKGFWQFQISYKQADYKLEDWLGKDCVNGTPTYEKYQQFTFRKKDLSFNVLAGELFRISNTVFVELYGGFGIKIKEQRPTEKNACYRNASGFKFNIMQEHYNTANVPIGMKLLVAIK